MVVEPLQGEGGFIPAPIEWIRAVRQICDENGILLIADEVQSGFCRTGRMFASDYWKEAGIEPDIIATAKSIAGGVPLSAIIARDEIMIFIVRFLPSPSRFSFFIRQRTGRILPPAPAAKQQQKKLFIDNL